jgi:acylphosphatase
MREAALRLGVQGWVRNREDGTVEAVLQGDPEDVEKLLEWAGSGPPGSRVSQVDKVLLEGYRQQAGFKIVVPDWWEEEGEE